MYNHILNAPLIVVSPVAIFSSVVSVYRAHLDLSCVQITFVEVIYVQFRPVSKCQTRIDRGVCWLLEITCLCIIYDLSLSVVDPGIVCVRIC